MNLFSSLYELVQLYKEADTELQKSRYLKVILDSIEINYQSIERYERKEQQQTRELDIVSSNRNRSSDSYNRTFETEK